MPFDRKTLQLRYVGQFISFVFVIAFLLNLRLLRLLGLTSFGFDALRVYRIKRHLDFLAEDDRFLLQDKPQLSQGELNQALEERGLCVIPTNVVQLKLNLSRFSVDPQASLKSSEVKLQWWLNSVQSSNPADALARRLSLIIQHTAGARLL
jgi:LETM1 and EF-hand domain-containing protein 1